MKNCKYMLNQQRTNILNQYKCRISRKSSTKTMTIDTIESLPLEYRCKSCLRKLVRLHVTTSEQKWMYKMHIQLFCCVFWKKMNQNTTNKCLSCTAKNFRNGEELLLIISVLASQKRSKSCSEYFLEEPLTQIYLSCGSSKMKLKKPLISF